MFIDVTRYGGMRILRLQVAAIAYLDECEGGAAIRLIGGETLRVNEDPQQIEARVDATMSLSIVALQVGDRRIEFASGTTSPATDDGPKSDETQPEPDGPGKLPPQDIPSLLAAAPPAAKPKKTGAKRQ
jgi:hypothetical protein